MNRAYLILTLILTPLFTFARTPMDAVIEAEDFFYNMSFISAERILAEIPEDCSSLCRVRVSHVRGLLAREAGDKATAASWFARMEDICREAQELKNSADGYAWIAQARSKLMLVRGIGYVIRNSPTLERLANQALDIDPGNITALLVLARGKLNAPKIFGGDTELAISLLTKVLVAPNLERRENFLAHLNLAKAHKKRKNLGLAKAHVSQALEIFPRNAGAIALLRKLE